MMIVLVVVAFIVVVTVAVLVGARIGHDNGVDKGYSLTSSAVLQAQQQGLRNHNLETYVDAIVVTGAFVDLAYKKVSVEGAESIIKEYLQNIVDAAAEESGSVHAEV